MEKSKPYMFNRPCLRCGVLVLGESLCPQHMKDMQAAKDRARVGKRQHYSGNYKQRSKQVRQTATVCWICKQGPIINDPFQADHVIDGNPNSPLLPAHRSCNIKRSLSKPKNIN